jgi:aminopeptidase 2
VLESFLHFRVTQELVKRFKDYVSGNEKALNPNLQPVAYTALLGYSTDAKLDFDAVISLYKTSSSVDQKLSALGSLGCINDMNCVTQLLKMSLDTEFVKPQDIIYPLSNLGGESALKTAKLDALWHFVVENWALLHERYKASLSLLGRVLSIAINKRVGSEFLDKVEAWARGEGLSEKEKELRKEQLKTAARPLEQSLEKARGQTAWVDREKEALKNWVKENKLV